MLETVFKQSPQVLEQKGGAPNSNDLRTTSNVWQSLAHCVSCVINEPSGVRGLYRGLATSLGGIVPYAGIDLMVLPGIPIFFFIITLEPRVE